MGRGATLPPVQTFKPSAATRRTCSLTSGPHPITEPRQGPRHVVPDEWRARLVNPNVSHLVLRRCNSTIRSTSFRATNYARTLLDPMQNKTQYAIRTPAAKATSWERAFSSPFRSVVVHDCARCLMRLRGTGHSRLSTGIRGLPYGSQAAYSATEAVLFLAFCNVRTLELHAPAIGLILHRVYCRSIFQDAATGSLSGWNSFELQHCLALRASLKETACTIPA